MSAWLAIFWKELGASALIFGLIAFAWFAPAGFSWQTRMISLVAAAAVAATTWSYNVGVSNGRALEQAAQQRGLAKELTNGEQIRTDADRAVVADPDGVRDDKWNRDNGQR